MKGNPYTASFTEYADTFLSGEIAYGSYFEYERRYKEELIIEERKDHVFVTTFERLKVCHQAT